MHRMSVTIQINGSVLFLHAGHVDFDGAVTCTGGHSRRLLEVFLSRALIYHRVVFLMQRHCSYQPRVCTHTFLQLVLLC